jgi:hypothetical protein
MQVFSGKNSFLLKRRSRKNSWILRIRIADQKNTSLRNNNNKVIVKQTQLVFLSSMSSVFDPFLHFDDNCQVPLEVSVIQKHRNDKEKSGEDGSLPQKGE